MIDILGYAVVCEADCIADASGRMPASLKTEAEWAFFQNGLDACDAVVLGRKSHEVTPNPKARRRLVMTRGETAPRRLGQAPTVLWNPDHADMQEALQLFETGINRLGITGGQGVFDYFLTGPSAYTHFYLSRIAGVLLSGGQTVFSDMREAGPTAEDCLSAAGYTATEHRQLDEVSSVVRWTHSA
ncbi:MAG: hypothetical protein AAGK23_03260 [Pseudomonadota bacterium]